MQPTLVSHALCPYVQRVAIVLLEKAVPFEQRYVDLSDKPAWFLDVSPLGKTPVLLAGGEAVFESAVICEYLDDTHLPRLHPSEPLSRARHRAWVEFGSALLSTIAGYYQAADGAAWQAKRDAIKSSFAKLEDAVDPDGPYFAGAVFSMVDASFAPVFRYLDAFETLGQTDWLTRAPRVQRWRAALAARASVRQAVDTGYPKRLVDFLRARGSELSRSIALA